MVADPVFRHVKPITLFSLFEVAISFLNFSQESGWTLTKNNSDPQLWIFAHLYIPGTRENVIFTSPMARFTPFLCLVSALEPPENERIYRRLITVTDKILICKKCLLIAALSFLESQIVRQINIIVLKSSTTKRYISRWALQRVTLFRR